MKVGKNRRMLEIELRKAIYDVNLTRHMTNEVMDSLMEKGYTGGDVKSVLDGNVPLEFLSLIDLGVYADVIHKATNIESVNPEIYYTDIEMEQIKNFKEEDYKEVVLEYPLVFNNVFEQSNDQWIGVISIQDVVRLLQAKKIRYNYKTQRNPIYIKHRDTLIQRPNINNNSVINIKDLIIKGQYIPDTLTFNIFADGYEDFIYDRKRNRLIIKDGNLDMLDGMHRSLACEGALLENPNIELNFPLMLTNFDVDKANRYILQKDLRNPLDEEYKQSLNITEEHNAIVKEINEKSNSDIRGLIVTDDSMITAGKGLTRFSVMAKTIQRLWNPQHRRDVRIISRYLINFFNELVGIYPDPFKLNIEKYKRSKSTLINHQYMFIYYLVIAKEIQNMDNWEDTLFDILNNTDFSNDNKYWDGTVLYVRKDRIDKNLPNIIAKHQTKIKNLIKEV